VIIQSFSKFKGVNTWVKFHKWEKKIRRFDYLPSTGWSD
jgi:hypothetical protein